MSADLPSSAVSPDGAWRFEGGELRSATATVRPFAVDFFERWTYARWLPDGHLVLAFESGQPFNEDGSYGDRYGGVQVLALTAPATWTVVALEFDYRAHDETFVPAEVVWHPRGVLGWLHGRTLLVQRLPAPRSEPAVHPVDPQVYTRDSDLDLAWRYELPGAWRGMTLDAEGLRLTATDDAGVTVFDLDARRRSRDGGAWEPLLEW